MTKLRYAAGEGNTESSSGESSGMSSGKADPAHGLQIVGMSATLPNVAAVADWLDVSKTIFISGSNPKIRTSKCLRRITFYNIIDFKGLDSLINMPNVYVLLNILWL